VKGCHAVFVARTERLDSLASRLDPSLAEVSYSRACLACRGSELTMQLLNS